MSTTTLPDWLWVAALFGLVAFGGLCGAMLLWLIRGRPLEAQQRETERRLRHVEKCLAVNDAVYRIHYKHLRREQTIQDERILAMAREMPTCPPPCRVC